MKNESVNRRELTEEEISMFSEELEWRIPDPDAEPVTEEKKKKVRELMKHCLSDEEFSQMELYRKKGCICVNTPRNYWTCLMGCLWVVDLEKGTADIHWQN